MKITKFEHFHVDCGWEIYSFLKISTDEGLTGWSEFREHRRPGIAAAIHGMGEFVVGQDPGAIGRLEAALYSFTCAASRAGSTRTPPAQFLTPASTSRARLWACRL